MSGQIPISSNHAAQIHNQALEIAAAHLERTAAEYDQKAEQQAQDNARIRPFGSLTPAHMEREYKGKATLLLGQAAHIRELKLKEQ